MVDACACEVEDGGKGRGVEASVRSGCGDRGCGVGSAEAGGRACGVRADVRTAVVAMSGAAVCGGNCNERRGRTGPVGAEPVGAVSLDAAGLSGGGATAAAEPCTGGVGAVS